MSRATFPLGTTSVNNCLVLLFAATSLTSDRVMSPNGCFFHSCEYLCVRMRTMRGVKLWGGGGWRNSKLCAFLKRGRNSSYEACTDDVEAAYQHLNV